MSGALGFVGGVVGGFIGGLFGVPSLGYSIGSALGGSFEPNKQVHGPRITDLKAQSSQAGIMQPMVFGAELIAGNIIWASGKREIAKTESQGKGGGGGTDTTTYTYFQDFAIGLADADDAKYVGIRLVKANGKVIYNVNAEADSETRIESDKLAKYFKFYSGSETQMPDPTIEAAVGVGHAPAHRGLCYVVFKNFEITEYGGQTPNMQFELIQSEQEELTDFKIPELRFTECTWHCGEYPINQAGPFPVFPSHDIMFTDAAIASVRTAALTYFPDRPRTFHWTVSSGGYDGKAALFTDGFTSILYSAAPWAGHDAIAMIDGNADRPARAPAKHYVYVDYIVPSDSYTLVRLPAGSQQYRGLRRPVANLGDYGENFRAGLGPCLRYDHPDFNNEDFWRAEAQKAGIPANSFGVDFGQYCEIIAHNVFYYEDIQKSNGVSLASIVKKICSRAGLADGEIDVSELTDKVYGYKLAAIASARDNLNPLMLSHFFDGYCDGEKVRFRKRGSDPVTFIPYGDLAARAGNDTEPARLTITRQMESEMPQKVTVNFSDFKNGYEIGSESASRVTTTSKQQEVVEIPVSITHSKAAQLADIVMRMAYIERHKFSFSCSRAYSYLEPTDVIEVENEEGYVYRVRLTHKDDSSGILAFQAVSEDGAYSSYATAFETIANNGIPSSGPTGMEVLDIPMLYDTHDDPGFYAALTSPAKSWPGALVVTSLDRTDYSTTGISADQSAVIGKCDTKLGDWKGGPVFDKSNTFDVTLEVGQLESKARNLILNGSNLAIVGNEIIQFMSAELVGEKTYRLSNLLRGLRGTEQHIGTHAVNDRFILVARTGFVRIPAIATYIGTKRYYKAVTKGGKLGSAETIEVTNTAAGLKPLAPVLLGGGFPSTGKSDLVMRWQRRSRVDSTMRNNVGVALGEASEKYMVEIYKDSAVKRTIATNADSCTYTEVMQIEDFGSPQSEIDVRVYQISDVVGKGFAAAHKYKRG